MTTATFETVTAGPHGSEASAVPVHDPVEPAPDAEAVGLLKSVAWGSLAGVVISFSAVLLAMVLGGYGWGPGVGLAAFTAFWGGLGFGSMVGGVLYLSAHEEH